jgi:predicted nucleotidyltransferase
MEGIFSTKERIKILKAIIFRKGNLNVNNIANQLRLSKGLLSKYFDILVRKGILKKVNKKFSVADFSFVRAIRILFNVTDINPKVFKKYPFVKSVGLYGSCAKGENDEDSDVDLWIMVEDTSEERLASLRTELNRKVRNVRILFLTKEKIEKLKEEDTMFYHSLVFGSIILYGDKYGIQI